VTEVPSNRHRLRFTGTVDHLGFVEACSRQPWWYHSYYFDNEFEVRGDYDVGADVSDYDFEEDMSGMDVLDVGTGAGWFAHFFHERGARVTTVDARGYCDFDVFGRPDHLPIEADDTSRSSVFQDRSELLAPTPAGVRPPDRYGPDGVAQYFSSVSGAFFAMRDLTGADIEFLNSTAYEICPELFGGRQFDLVFMGALLCHLRDPIGALNAARKVCRDRIVVSTPVVLGSSAADPPLQYLPYTDIDVTSWWLPNEACFRLWLEAAGFINVDVSQSITLRGDIPHVDPGGRVHNGDQTHRIGRASV